jgi:NADPH:quinone reductase-like Zn-dependent oxidoreductase
MAFGLGKPQRPILGSEVAGETAAVGKDVGRFRKGDQVNGCTGLRRPGTYAEYMCMPEKGALAIKPPNITYEEAAAAPHGALCALPFLRDWWLGVI